MDMVVMQVIDNYKNGRVEGYCLLSRGTGDIVGESREIFRDAKPEACEKLKQ